MLGGCSPSIPTPSSESRLPPVPSRLTPLPRPHQPPGSPGSPTLRLEEGRPEERKEVREGLPQLFQPSAQSLGAPGIAGEGHEPALWDTWTPVCTHTHRSSVSGQGSVPGVLLCPPTPPRPAPCPSGLPVCPLPTRPLPASPDLLITAHLPLAWDDCLRGGVSPGSCFFKSPSPESRARAGPFLVPCQGRTLWRNSAATWTHHPNSRALRIPH